MNVALDRLLALGMVEWNEKNKKWILIEEAVSNVDENYSQIANRKMQKQLLEKAVNALELIPFENRDQSSISFPMSKNKIKEAKLLLKEFRMKFAEILQNDENASDVYQLVLGFYPLTQTNKEKLK